MKRLYSITFIGYCKAFFLNIILTMNVPRCRNCYVIIIKIMSIFSKKNILSITILIKLTIFSENLIG